MTSKFVVDLTKIDGDGPFPCPKCGSTIDPDTQSYGVLDVPVKDGMRIECNKCKSQIDIIGLGTVEAVKT